VGEASQPGPARQKKKLLRSADAEFLAGQTPDLPKLQLQLRELKIDDIELETGRPRTEAYIVYLFLMLRGFNGGCKDQHAGCCCRSLSRSDSGSNIWAWNCRPPARLSDNLNAVSNQTRSLIHQVQLRYIFQGGLDDFQKCFVDSTAVEANTERPTDSSILIKLIARVCNTGGNLHRLDLPNMNQIGLLEQQEELRRLSQQIHFLNGKARGDAKRRKFYFHLIRRVRRLRKRLLRDLESVRRSLDGRADLPPSRRLMGEEALCLIAEDLAPAELSPHDVKSVSLELVREEPIRRNPWRPTTLTIRKFLRICHLVEQGWAVSRACEAECITYSRFRMRVARSKRLQERLKEAEATRFNLRHEQALASVMAAGEKSWMAHAWWLERCLPHLYALRAVERESLSLTSRGASEQVRIIGLPAAEIEKFTGPEYKQLENGNVERVVAGVRVIYARIAS
jgi:hypothetical protein